jgi:RHS repeat-associated protein
MKATINDSGVFVGDGNGQWSEAYNYDKLSNITSHTDARGVIANYSRVNPNYPNYSIDPLNRLFAVSYNTNGATDVLPSPTVNYSYETTGDIGRIKSVTATGVSTTEIGYDSLSRINEKKTTILSRPSSPMKVNYLYDSLSRVTDVIYPDQYGTSSTRKNLHYDFDIAGRMNNFKVDNVNYASEFNFNVNDQVTSVKIGPSGANQITETYNYNAMTGLLENQKVLKGSSSLLDLSYEYQQCSCSTGGSGQITKITNNLDPNKNKKYEYDALARLKKVTGGINQGWSQEYKYDRYGNRTEVKALGFEALRLSSSSMSKETQDEQNNILEKSTQVKAPTSKELISTVKEMLPNEDFADSKSKNDSPITQYKQSEYLESSSNVRASNPPSNHTQFDFDNDGKADVSVWQRSNGLWSYIKSSNNQTISDQFGSNGNQIAPGDYDGDGKTDEAVWIPSSGDWWIKYSSNNSVITIHWGATGDTIVPADYDGDGKTDIGIWRASTGSWYVVRSSDWSWFGAPFGGGQFGDIPVPGDYDGDGKADLAVWRPSNGVWYVYQSSNGQALSMPFGTTGDVPVQSDFDADGKTDFAVWRPSNGTWYYLNSGSGNSFSYVQWGSETLGDVLVPADYDGDHKTDVAVFRPSASAWYILRSTDGGVTSASLGNSGNVAVPSAYIRRSSAPKGQNVPIPRDGFANIAFDQNTNRITTSGFEYDLAGNQTKVTKEDGTIFRYQYDAAGRMVKVKNNNGQTLTTYTYGESRERLITQEGDENSTNRTYYAWEGGAVISEYVDINNALQWTKNYIYMGGSLLATQEQTVAGEKVQFDHADQLGTRLITDPGTGTSFEQATLPFGTALESESTGAINRRFTSYDRSASNGLDYAVNRFYDSNQGRFTQVDPIGMASTSLKNPQSLNLYAYTENDPINKTDPTGLDDDVIRIEVRAPAWVWWNYNYTPPPPHQAGNSIWGGIFGSFIGGLFGLLGGSSAGYFIHTPLNTGVDTNMTATYGLPGMNTTENIDPNTTSNLDEPYLLFDGCSLTFFNSKGEAEKKWGGGGVGSGKIGTTVADQNKADFGPIPDTATYTVGPGDTEYYIKRWSPMIAWNTIPIVGIVYPIIIGYEPVYQHWAQTQDLRDAWGQYRTRIRLRSGTTGGRDGFYIHGGKFCGSAGCIDLTKSNNDFHEWLKDYGRRLMLKVEYSCYPWNK